MAPGVRAGIVRHVGAGHDAAGFLAQVPLFARLPESVRDELAAASYWKHLPGGDFLFHQGDAADSLALVWSGRLLVIDESSTDGDGVPTIPEHRVIGLLGRGKWVGELSLLTGEPRAAAIKAMRDSELLVLPAKAFNRVLDEHPQLGMTLARMLAAQLQRSPSAPSAPSKPDTICVIPLGATLPVERLVERLARHFATYGPVAIIGDDGAVLQSDGPNYGPLRVPAPAATAAVDGDAVVGPAVDGDAVVGGAVDGDAVVGPAVDGDGVVGPVVDVEPAAVDDAVVGPAVDGDGEGDPAAVGPAPIGDPVPEDAVPADPLPVDVVSDEQFRRWAQRLDELETQHPWVVLVSSDPANHQEWASFCVRSADRVLALVRGGRPPAWAATMLASSRADVVFVGTTLQAARLAPTLQALSPRTHHHLPEGGSFNAAADRVARRASGHALGLVLSGGGARGLAHLGVLERLVEARTPIDRIGGCSAGAFAAGLFAMGETPAEMIATCREELVDHHPFTDFTVPREGLIKGKRTMAMLTRVFGDLRIEQLSLSYFAVSADLATGELVVHTEGLLREAIAASMSIPGFSPPVAVDGQLLVDGGLLDNFPVDVMLATGEGPVIGVDVMRAFPLPDGLGSVPAAGSTGGRSRTKVFRELDGPGIVSTIARSMVLGGWQRAEANRRATDLLISPAVEDIGLFDFDRIDEAIEAGRRATDEALSHGLPR